MIMQDIISSQNCHKNNSTTMATAALITELKQGKEFAEQLQMHFHEPSSPSSSPIPSPSSSSPTKEYLLTKILNTYNNLFSMINLVENGSKTGTINSPLPPSPESLHGVVRPRSGEDQMAVPLSKKSKKKMLSRRSERIKLSPEMAEAAGATWLEGSALRDGYSWRKYGQKNIQGTNHPRNYYRCTYRHTQNCLAKKQLQKSDDDPTIVHVIYTGDHTCRRNNQPPNQRPQLITNSVHHQLPYTTTTAAVAVTPTHTTSINTLPSDTPQHSDLSNYHTTPNTYDDDTAQVTTTTNVDNYFFRSYSFSLSFKSLLQPDLEVDLDTIFNLPAESDTNQITATPTHSSTSSTWNLNFGSGSGCSLIGGTSESEFNEGLSSTGPDSVNNSPIGGANCLWLDDFEFNALS